jgi:hypothetical protein
VHLVGFYLYQIIFCGYTVWEQQLGESYVVQQEQHMSLGGVAAT